MKTKRRRTIENFSGRVWGSRKATALRASYATAALGTYYAASQFGGPRQARVKLSWHFEGGGFDGGAEEVRLVSEIEQVHRQFLQGEVRLVFD